MLIVMVILAGLVAYKSFVIVPQQEEFVVERLGEYRETLTAGLHFLIPFIDVIRYKHVLKEVALDIPSQICITKDNTQLGVDGVLYFRVTNAKDASYGSADYVAAISQLAQTALRSAIGRLELDETFESRDNMNAAVIAALDEAAVNWGVKVLRYEVKDLTPPEHILKAMQAQITAEREKRARIANSEGQKIEKINLATGDRDSLIARSEGDQKAAINEADGEREAMVARAKGEADSILLVAKATAEALEIIGKAVNSPGGREALQLKVAEQALNSFAEITKNSKNTVLLPNDMSQVGSMITTAMSLVGNSGVKEDKKKVD